MAYPNFDWDAVLRGAGQGATLGWGDEGAAKLLELASRFQDDGTGIPREYAGGQENQYKNEIRADNAAAQARAPGAYLSGQIAGGAPLAVATSPLGGGGTAAARIAASGLQGGVMGGLQGAGESERSGRGLAEDAAKGAAVGGVLGAALPAAGEGLKAGRQMVLDAADAFGPQLAYAGVPAGAVESFGGRGVSAVNAARPLASVGGGAAKKAPVKAPAAPEQLDLPGIPEPEYFHHATPASNGTGIAETGLRPEQGAKNFNFKKNKNRVYMSSPDEAEHWAEKLEHLTGEEPLKLRTTAPARQHPTAMKGVMSRSEPVAPERIQRQRPDGSWGSVKELRPAEPAPAGPNPDQLNLPMSTMRKFTPARQAALESLTEGMEGIGKGHTRRAVDNMGQAMKVPVRPEGVDQNLAEGGLWDKYKHPVMNPVTDRHPEGHWLKQRLVEPFDAESLSQHVGMPVPEDPMDNWLRDMAKPGFHGPQPTAEATELHNRIQQIIRDVPEIDPRDLGKPGQLARNLRGEPVVIDYGYVKKK